MKSTTYRIKLSDGKKVQITANSAAESIEKALRDHRGRTVIGCYSGLTKDDCDLLRQIDADARCMPGIITHDIPPHEAYSESATFPLRSVNKDLTESMFNEEEILYESQAAKNKRSNEDRKEAEPEKALPRTRKKRAA